jgi:hypothetical protein
VGLGLSVFQQFVGINVIFYYSNILWQPLSRRIPARVVVGEARRRDAARAQPTRGARLQ